MLEVQRAYKTQLTEHDKDEITRMIVSGQYPIDAEIAAELGVASFAVTKFIEDNPELQEYRAAAQKEMAQRLEQHAFELAMGKGMTAAVMMKEILPKLKPEVYGEEAAIISKAKGVRRVMLGTEDLPEVESPKVELPKEVKPIKVSKPY